MKRVLTLTTIILLLGLVPHAMAQETATVTGTVTDATGALIPGAEVTATNNNTGITSLGISGETGSYTLQGLQPGPYSIVSSLPGFSDATIEVNLTGNQTFRFNFELQVGAVATAVEVVSDADALLATTGASVGDALPEEEVVALPLGTRDVFDLLSTTAGLVRRDGGDDGSNFAGQRVSSVNTTRDGVPVSDGRYLDWNGAFSATYSSPDLVEEVQVSVGTVDAASGRGSSQVRLQTRSGTNEFHGALFYGTNNSALNANTFFQNLNGQKKNWTNRNQFGGRIGGPIVRNKAFFFVLLDEQRYKTRTNVTGQVWTQQALAGNFRYWPGVENNNALGGGEASVDLNGNPVRPAGATGDLQSFHLFSDVNDPNRGSGPSSNAFIQESFRRMPVANNFTVGDGLNTAGINWVRSVSGIDNAAGTSQNTNRDNLNVRLDYQINNSNKVLFVQSREHNYNDASQPTWPGGYAGESTRDPGITTIGWTATVTPTVLNEFRFGFRKTNWSGRPPFSLGCCVGDNESPTDGLTEAGQEAFEFFEFSGPYPYMPPMSSLGGNLWMTTPTGTTTRDQTSPLWTYSDTVSWVQGAHSFTAGWDGVWADSDGWNSGGLWPRVALGDGDFQAAINADSFPGLEDADANLARSILNDQAGSVSQLNQTFLVNDPAVGFIDIRTSVKQSLNFHQDDWAAFFKDDWNVSQNLTLNYGVRWDVYGVPYEGKGLNAVPVGNRLTPSSSGELVSVINVGKHSLNPDLGMYPRDWDNLAPSLGFSYNVPWLDRTTVVRGGYGVSYSGAPTFLQFDFGIGRQAGKSDSVSITPSVYTAVPGSTNPNAALAEFPLAQTIAEPFGVVPLTNRRSSLYTYADDRRIPYIQNFNVSIETEIAANTNLSVTWLATKGTSLWSGYQLNEPNIYASSNGESILDGFITTRQGGDSALFADMFEGLNFGRGTCGTINGTTCTASKALRQWSLTDDYFADGEAAGFAEFVNSTSSAAAGGVAGGLLRANGYPENFIVASPQFNQVDVYDNGDNSTYHSMQVQLTKRQSSGFSGQFSYTWSKAIGNGATSTFRAREDQSFGTRDNRNRALQKGVVPYSRTHAFNAHGVWSLPFGPGRLLGSGAPSAIARIIEGWQLSSILSWDSGEPVGVTSSMETLVAEDDINTPDLVGGYDAFPKSLGQVNVGADGNVTYLDIENAFRREREPTLDYYGGDPDGLASHDALYQIVDASGNVILRNPKPGTTGNLSTNWLTGPGRLGLDMALSKSVQITEGTEFTLRMDGIDILNTPRWGQPNLNINSSNFGRITRASGARTFTLNARIDF